MSRVNPKAVQIKIQRPDDLLNQALSRYKGIVNSSLKPPEKEDPAVPYLLEVDFTVEFRTVKLKETAMKVSEYNSPAFKKAKVTPETLCYYLSVVRHNKVKFNNKEHDSGYIVHHLAFPLELKQKNVTETQIKYDMFYSMIEYLLVYGVEWIEHSVQNRSRSQIASSSKKINEDIDELEKLANNIGAEQGVPAGAEGDGEVAEGKRSV